MTKRIALTWLVILSGCKLDMALDGPWNVDVVADVPAEAEDVADSVDSADLTAGSDADAVTVEVDAPDTIDTADADSSDAPVPVDLADGTDAVAETDVADDAADAAGATDSTDTGAETAGDADATGATDATEATDSGADVADLVELEVVDVAPTMDTETADVETPLDGVTPPADATEDVADVQVPDPCLGLNCDDGNTCTQDTCANGGCVNLAKAATCDDGSACTSGDTCVATGCMAGATATCIDGNACTDDGCAPASGCVFAANTAPCDDGNACTGGDVCTDTLCGGSVNVKCSARDGCHDIGVCDVGTGTCSNPTKSDGITCSDDSACTVGDMCGGGVCLPGPVTACTDGNPCTDDGCDVLAGCEWTNNSVVCSDGNACTTGDVCKNGGCVGGPAPSCTDTNPCTDDMCDSAKGCQHLANTTVCDDKSPCTTNDKCGNGACGGTALPDCTTCAADADCDDANVCTDDACGADGTCFHAQASGVCSDGNACTTPDTCQAGVCVGVGKVACIDGNACTDDNCEPATGCVYPNNLAPCQGTTGCGMCSGGACVVDDTVHLEASYGGTGNEIARTVAAIPGGGLILAGSVTLVTNTNDTAGYVVRVDAAGKKLWDKTFASPHTEKFTDVKALPDGGFILAGVRFAGSCLTKLDSTGSLVWESCFSVGGDGSKPPTLALVADGSIYLGANEGHFWLAHVSASGTTLWTHDYPSLAIAGWSFTDNMTGFTVLPDGSLFLVGFVDYLTGLYFATLSSEPLTLLSDNAGAIQWFNAAPEVDDQFHKIFATLILPDLSIITAGVVGQYPGFGVNTSTSLARVRSADGTTIWSTTPTIQGFNEAALSLSRAADGGIVGIGTGSTSAANPTQYNGILSWTDLTGRVVWNRLVAVSGNSQRIYGGTQLSDGSFVLVGSTNAKSYNGLDMYLAHVDAFGYMTCAAAGPLCGGALHPADCDDGNACTVDTCDTLKGCVHASLNDASACGDGCSSGGVCSAGACVGATLNNSKANGCTTARVFGGGFQMGCTNGDAKCGADESPVHEVTLSPYFVDTHEVTVAQYAACSTAGVCTAAASTIGCNAAGVGKDNHPVNCVTWDQAAAYCAWSQPYARLPTEAEWERAARGVGDSKYPWGTAAPDCTRANFMGKAGGCVGATAAVGSYATGASPLGAADFAGNVAEWVFDLYDAGTYTTTAYAIDPSGPATGAGHIVRGGSYSSAASGLRVTARSVGVPVGDATTGMRCARPVF